MSLWSSFAKTFIKGSIAMESGILVLILFVVTFGAVLAAAIVGKRRTEKTLNDPNAPKSALAKDGPSGRIEDRV